MKSNPTGKPTPSNFKANLLMVLLVLGVPIGAKLIMQNARAATSQQVQATDPMSVARHGHTASILTDGRVLIAGGDLQVKEDGTETSTAEIVDPANPQYVSPTYQMTEPRSGHSATPLNNSLVYLAGGNANPSAELFNPTGPDDLIFSTEALAIPSMTTSRIGHTAIIGAYNKIYLIGGDAAGSVELNDPYTGANATNLGTLAIS